MLNEFELKREEEKHQKTLQKYEELLAMEIEWHTQRIASINFFLAKIKKAGCGIPRDTGQHQR
jgi:hypothetical protein